MADDVTPTGFPLPVAADDVGGKLHQRMKISIGADGSATDLSSANPMPIGALPAGTALIGKVDHSSTGIGHGVKTVTTAGTDVALASSTVAKWVTIQAQTDNTSSIAVGATGVDAAVAAGTGILLSAGQSITLPIDNLADVYIDALVNGEGVRFIYGT